MKAICLLTMLLVSLCLAELGDADSTVTVTVTDSRPKRYALIGNMVVDTIRHPPTTKADSVSPDTVSGSSDTIRFDSIFNDTVARTIISSDSATIISPAPLSILDSTETVYEISPVCPVDSVVLMVHYYPSRTDTLKVIKKPPYRVTWNYEHIPDQDQTQLQFGYTLYHPQGDTILSPPMPHRWVIDRSDARPRQTYNCHELPVYDSIIVDGRFDDWPNVRPFYVGEKTQVRLSWTAAFFFAAITVSDDDITPGDHVELMFDLQSQRNAFAGIEQRIISVGPRRRRFTWAVQLHDSASVQVDSILVRTGDEMEWRAREHDGGYSVEVKIPFVILADIHFPPKEFGFDLAVIEDSGRRSRSYQPTITSWTRTHPASRHNPSQWGTVKLKQVWLPLKLTLAGLVIIALGIVAGMVWLIFHKIRKDREGEQQTGKKLSPLSQTAVDAIQRNLKSPSFTIDSVLKHLSVDKDTLNRSIEEDFGCDFDSLLYGQRIKHARSLIRDTEDDFLSIARQSGFSGLDEFSQSFTRLAGVSPEKYRENRLADSMEEEEEEE